MKKNLRHAFSFLGCFAILTACLLQMGRLAFAQSSSLEAFGIFSPVMGVQEAMPSITIPEAFTHDNENVVLKYGEIHRCKMRSDQCVDGSNDGVVLPDGNPILRYHYLQTSGGTDYLLAFTTENVYHWDSVGKEWDRKFNCYTGSATTWSTVTFKDLVVATNNSDTIQVWDGTWNTFLPLSDWNGTSVSVKYDTGTVTTVNGDATIEGSGVDWVTAGIEADDLIFISGDTRTYKVASVTDLDTLELTENWSGTGASELNYDIYENDGLDLDGAYLTKAKLLESFETYLLALNVTAGGSTYPQGIYWCNTFDESDWNSGYAGNLILPGPDPISGTGQIADFLLVFSNRHIDQIWATESTLVFNARRLRNNMGSYSPDSIINGPSGELYFMDNRKNLRVIQSPMSDMEVVSRYIDPTVKLIQDSLISNVRACWCDSLEQIWWSIPYGTDATANNKVICYDVYNAWTKRDMAVSAFGNYEEKTTYTIDTIPFDTIDEIGWETIDSVESVADYLLDICGDASGYTWDSHNSEQDAGSNFTGYAVIGTDFSQVKGTPLVDRYKRLAFLTVIFRNEGAGTATISLKRDFESGWNSLGSVSLSGSTDMLWHKLNADYRARYFQVKISGTNMFRFVGCIFYYITESLR